MMLAGIYSLEITNHDDLFSEVERLAEGYQGKRFCISRLPQRTLLRHLSLEEYECYWLSEQDTARSVPPTIEAMHHLLNAFIQENTLGLSVIEGLNWFVQREGIDSVMNLLQRIETITANTNHTLLFPMDALAFDAIDWARIRSIAPAMEQPPMTEVERIPHPEQKTESIEHGPQQESQLLAQLTSLPSLGFNKTQLSKRMLQWKRMGFDVSDLEPALSLSDSDEIHGIYLSVEEKIRTAVELARLLTLNRENYDVTTFEVTMFRIMQLTGLDEIESMLHARS